MTSSLVGSEMCIRDRSCAWRQSHMVFSGMEIAASRPRGKAPSEATGATSVSYTHLTLPTICSV
eukprot:2985736-Prorocentrum_lima.AAC.1